MLVHKVAFYCVSAAILLLRQQTLRLLSAAVCPLVEQEGSQALYVLCVDFISLRACGLL